MIRTIWFQLAENEKYPLCFTLGAAKVFQLKWGDMKGFLSAAEEAKKGLDFRPLLFCMELLIRQGCARLNTFCHDLPVEPGAPLTQRGFYKPISADEFAEKIAVYQIMKVPSAIVDAYNLGIKGSIEGSYTAEARANLKGGESSGKLAWYDYQARTFGISQKEYNLLTIGEIQDLAVCRAISRGIMTEEIDTPHIPRWK